MNALDFFAQQSTGYLHGGGQKGTQQLLAQFQLEGHEKLLEIGVGTGASLVAVKSLWPALDVSGVEVNPLMLQKAKARLRFCQLSSIPIHKVTPDGPYPFPDAHFDQVLVESVLAIQPLERLSKIFDEIERILKPGGVLAFNETLWLPQQELSQIRAFNQACLQHFGIIQASDELVDLDAWKNWLSNRNWNIRYCEKVKEEQATRNLGWRHLLSTAYSKLGKVKSRLDRNHRQDASQLKSLEKELFAKYPLRLKAYILLANRASSPLNSTNALTEEIETNQDA